MVEGEFEDPCASNPSTAEADKIQQEQHGLRTTEVLAWCVPSNMWSRAIRSREILGWMPSLGALCQIGWLYAAPAQLITKLCNNIRSTSRVMVQVLVSFGHVQWVPRQSRPGLCVTNMNDIGRMRPPFVITGRSARTKLNRWIEPGGRVSSQNGY